jgi:hypothetical protein
MEKSTFDKLVEEIQKDIPLKIAYKDEEKSLKYLIVSFIVNLFNKRFNEFTTTLYPTVYFPKRSMDYESLFMILAHEYVHLWDEKNHRFTFPLSYLMPQILSLFSVFAILAIFSPWFLFFLLFLVFLIPWPSKWRTHWELRGYAMSINTRNWLNLPVSQKGLNSIVENFVNWNYYRMSWSKKSTLLKLMAYVDDTKNANKPYKVVKEILKDK